MRGKGHERLATRAFQQWRRLNFSVLCDQHMPTPHHATLRLPVRAHPTAALTSPAAPCSSAGTLPAVELTLATNSPALLTWWQHEFNPFLAAAATPTNSQPLATARVCAHVGPPAPPLGYPPYIALEAQAYTEGVLRSEAHAYNVEGASPSSAASAPYLSPVRWIQQPLVDGVVAQRVTAHTGVTTAALIDARHTALAMGRQLPPYAVSPFYTTNDLQDRWGLFGDAAAVVPPPPAASDASGDDAAQHHVRVAELALGAALLTNYRAAWLNAAVLSCRETGRAVLIVGPRRSGKTTLALHCLAADAAGVQLTAAEHAFVAAGSPVRRMLRTDADAPPHSTASPVVLACAVPHHVTVGLGAVLGTLRPNPALTAAAGELPPFLRSPAGLRAFLQNTDAVLWNMSQRYRVAVAGVGAQWAPAVVDQLAGIVLLDWNLAELESRSPVPVRTVVRAAPLHEGGLDELLARGRDYLFHGHQLLGTTYDGAVDGPERLADVLHAEWAEARPRPGGSAAPALRILEGSVNFDLATELVLGLLRGTR